MRTQRVTKNDIISCQKTGQEFTVTKVIGREVYYESNRGKYMTFMERIHTGDVPDNRYPFTRIAMAI